MELVNKLVNHTYLYLDKSLMANAGIETAVIYAELKRLYETAKIQPGDYLPCSIDDIYIETSLKQHSQRKALKQLKEMGMIDYKMVGIPARRCFKLIV